MKAPDPALYQAILERRSTRRYDPRPLEDDRLGAVERLPKEARPLLADNAFGCRLVRRVRDEDVAAFIGRYGALVSLTHMLVPHIIGGRHALVDLGFRMEQVAVWLTRMGVKSCFLGALSGQDAVQRQFGLPQEAAVGAALVFGRSPQTMGGRTVNALVRRAAGGSGRRPLTALCVAGDADVSADPSPLWHDVLEAGRWAPSARNVQPWRFVLFGDLVRVCVVPRNWRYGAQQAYRWFDVGACLGNMHLAALSRGQKLEVDLRGAGRAVDEGQLELVASVRLVRVDADVS